MTKVLDLKLRCSTRSLWWFKVLSIFPLLMSHTLHTYTQTHTHVTIKLTKCSKGYFKVTTYYYGGRGVVDSMCLSKKCVISLYVCKYTWQWSLWIHWWLQCHCIVNIALCQCGLAGSEHTLMISDPKSKPVKKQHFSYHSITLESSMHQLKTAGEHQYHAPLLCGPSVHWQSSCHHTAGSIHPPCPSHCGTLYESVYISHSSSCSA